MSGNKNKLIAFNYFGGKFTWLEHLYAHFPANFLHLVDLFAGSMGVSINYHGKVIKTANDINGDVTNFFLQLRDHEEELVRLLQLTPYSQQEYRNSWGGESDATDLERARQFYIRVRQSFFGLGAQQKDKGWYCAIRSTNMAKRWDNSIEKLHEVASEIRKNFQITTGDYADCIEKLDFPEAFFYADPPYPLESRGSHSKGQDYSFDFTDEDHELLAWKLHHIKGSAMISGYECSLMDYLYDDWYKFKFPFKRNNIRSGIKNGSGTIMQECIWCNYEPPVQNQKLF